MNINELHVLIVKGFIFFPIFKTTVALSINHAIYVLVLELKIIFSGDVFS